MDAIATHSAKASGALKVVAVSLTKIANDLVLMGSGPRTGLVELQLMTLPALVSRDDIRGDLHMHSTASDGSRSPAEVVHAAKRASLAAIARLVAQAALVKELHRPEQPVYLVDLATGFDPAKDTIADRVHPNAAGAEKIARRWAEALTPCLR